MIQQQPETPAPVPQSQAEAAAPGPLHHQPKSKSSRKATAIFVAVGVHVGLILIATTLTIFAASKDEPEIIASIAPPSAAPQQEMKKKSVQKQVKRAPSAASAAAAPMALMMKANAQARFSTPEITRTSTGPLGMGEGDLGAGAFGIGNGLGDGAAAGGGTLFGSTGAGPVKGFLYDIKRDGQGRTRPFGNGIYAGVVPHLNKLYKSKFSEASLSDHTQVGKQLTFTFLAIPPQDASIGPEAFGAKGEMNPAGWVVVYKGRIRARGPGAEIRLIGRFDDVILVFHNGILVFDGSYAPGKTVATGFRPQGEIPKNPLFNPPAGIIGPWFKLAGGDELMIVIGEIPGGQVGGGLFCQEKGVNYKEGKFAPFVIGRLSEEDKQRLKAVQDCSLERIPGFY